MQAVRPDTQTARERIIETASELFYRQGIRAVGVDTIVAQSGVAKMTLYRHFPSKDDLVIEVLRRRDERWREWLEEEVLQRAETPQGHLLAVFDALEAWFHSDEFRGSAFINTRVEIPDPDHPANRAAADHVAAVRRFFTRLADDAGAERPDDLAAQMQLIMKGAIVMALEGDPDAGSRARVIGSALLAEQGVIEPAG
ncbi:MAG: TetR/AcrR family transcriptional regulator [Thermoleophilia bacterium]|jgi:AcrR family transcriptional regulator|nr:TetR/AcrR family transcriptional regulator [Thermoleophilia bacterium]